MEKIFIVGGTSAIAERVARIYAARGNRLFLTGRRTERLSELSADLRTRGAAAVDTSTFDINDLDAHAHLIDQAWSTLGGFDVVLVAHGTLPNQDDCQDSVALAISEFTTNATSTIALVTALAKKIEPVNQGTIAVISSVAGDRGRASNYLYGAAKAAVSTFLSGLAQRLSATGVNVLTIKPGFVDTPMTASFKKGPLWASPEKVASEIVRAIGRRSSVAYVPRFWWPVMQIVRAIPEPVFRRLKL